jgi:CDP-4-dehydro-6-deoxyglucose reductase
MESFDGMISVENLLGCYPDAQLEDTVEINRIAQIKERAFGKRVFERALPDAEVLAVRVAELGQALANAQLQLKQHQLVLDKLWLRLEESSRNHSVDDLRVWLKNELGSANEPVFSNLLAVKDNMLRVMAAQVTILPSRHDFLLEGQDTLLEAAMRAGIPLNYGCSGGNCGLCKARVVSGQVKKTRHHDFVISDDQKEQGFVLLCSNTAVTDVVIEAMVAGSVQDIPYQQITATVKSLDFIGTDRVMLHVQTPRTHRLRFLAGQSVNLTLGRAYTAELPIASCPCDDRNITFHLRRQSGNLFNDYVFDRLKHGDQIELEGPLGEFILHEKSPRAAYFIAFDGGFAPVKSLIEHAMSLNIESIHLVWIASGRDDIYLPNVVRAWDDALDNFYYSENIAGFDLRVVTGHRSEHLLTLLSEIVSKYDQLVLSDVYLAGSASALNIAESFFLGLGMPKTRVSVKKV